MEISVWLFMRIPSLINFDFLSGNNCKYSTIESIIKYVLYLGKYKKNRIRKECFLEIKDMHAFYAIVEEGNSHAAQRRNWPAGTEPPDEAMRLPGIQLFERADGDPPYGGGGLLSPGWSISWAWWMERVREIRRSAPGVDGASLGISQPLGLCAAGVIGDFITGIPSDLPLGGEVPYLELLDTGH